MNPRYILIPSSTVHCIRNLKIQRKHRWPNKHKVMSEDSQLHSNWGISVDNFQKMKYLPIFMVLDTQTSKGESV